MSRITEAFANGKAFIPFLTCGDPSLEVTEQLVYAMEEAGADLIELGIPFSDPTAEGPVIQAANIRALSGGVTTDKVFAMVEKIRKNTTIPMVFMTYANVVFSYGTERFIKKAAEVGMDGLILPDGDYHRITKGHLHGLMALFPETEDEIWKMIPEDDSPLFWLIEKTGCVLTDYNNSIGMKMTPAQKQVFDAMRRHGFLTDDYYDLTKQREKVKKEREEKEQAQKS